MKIWTIPVSWEVADSIQISALTLDEAIHKIEADESIDLPRGNYVREGVLVLSYDEIEECDHEIFVRDSARLCDATQMQNFLTDLDLRSKALAESIQSLLSFLERKRIGSNSETNNLSNNKIERR